MDKEEVKNFWIDTRIGEPVYIDGSVNNPVDTYEEALKLSNSWVYVKKDFYVFSRIKRLTIGTTLFVCGFIIGFGFGWIFH